MHIYDYWRAITSAELPDLNRDSTPAEVSKALRTIMDKLIPYIKKRAQNKNKVWNAANGPGVSLGAFMRDDRYDDINILLEDGPDIRYGCQALCHTKSSGYRVYCTVYIYNCSNLEMVSSPKFVMLVTHEITHALQSHFGIQRNLPLSHAPTHPNDPASFSTAKEMQAYTMGFLAQFAKENERPPSGFKSHEFWTWMDEKVKATGYQWYDIVKASPELFKIVDEMVAHVFEHDHMDTEHDEPVVTIQPPVSHPLPPPRIPRPPQLPNIKLGPSPKPEKPTVKTVREVGFQPEQIVWVVGLYDKKYKARIVSVKGHSANIQYANGTKEKVPVANLRVFEG